MIFMDYYLFDCKILKNFPGEKVVFENEGFFQLFKSVFIGDVEMKDPRGLKLFLGHFYVIVSFVSTYPRSTVV